jgi:cold shock CspA family protein
MVGVIVRIDYGRQFGFICGLDDQSYYFHKSVVVQGVFDTLREGDVVIFTVGRPAARGPRCASVARTGDR